MHSCTVHYRINTTNNTTQTQCTRLQVYARCDDVMYQVTCHLLQRRNLIGLFGEYRGAKEDTSDNIYRQSNKLVRHKSAVYSQLNTSRIIKHREL